MIILFVATGIVIAGVAALTLDSWVVLGVVVGLHAIATVVVVGATLRRASDTSGKPDPVTEARLDEERSAGGDRYSQPRPGTS